ncbi:hypothetical protein GCM10022380_52250 [Amycolatopsis tucumanensis]|uniref:Uncharacterized protein n=1 Tax=Amycolatopsis tucumanensis TaxID=401106 RepID=A0ABP7IUX3_9PSEU
MTLRRRAAPRTTRATSEVRLWAGELETVHERLVHRFRAAKDTLASDYVDSSRLAGLAGVPEDVTARST